MGALSCNAPEIRRRVRIRRPPHVGGDQLLQRRLPRRLRLGARLPQAHEVGDGSCNGNGSHALAACAHLPLYLGGGQLMQRPLGVQRYTSVTGRGGL